MFFYYKNIHRAKVIFNGYSPKNRLVANSLQSENNSLCTRLIGIFSCLCTIQYCYFCCSIYLEFKRLCYFSCTVRKSRKIHRWVFQYGQILLKVFRKRTKYFHLKNKTAQDCKRPATFAACKTVICNAACRHPKKMCTRLSELVTEGFFRKHFVK